MNVMNKKEYVSPNLKLISAEIHGIICLSNDPDGSTSNEGYSETDLDW